MVRDAIQPAINRRMGASLTRPNIVVILSSLTAVMALIATGAGLFWQDGDGALALTTLHGQTVDLYGRGV